MGGKGAGECGPQRRGHERLTPVLRRGDDVADQGLVADDDNGPAHAGQAQQRRLDLPGLHPEAAYLDLRVDPAQELQLPVGPPAHQVPGPVAQRARWPPRVGHEGPRGGTRAAPVAVRHPHAADQQLTGGAARQRPAPRVAHRQGRSVERTPDGGRRVASAGPRSAALAITVVSVGP